MKPDSDLQHLIEQLCDGQLSDEEERQLEQLAQSHPVALAEIREQLETTHLLNDHYSPPAHHSFLEHLSQVSHEAPDDFTRRLESRIRRKKIIRLLVPLASAAAMLIAAFFLWPKKTNLPTRSVIATVVVFDARGNTLPSRSLHVDDSLSITEGRAKIQFTSGALLAIQGPGHLDLKSAFHVVLKQGRLNGWCPPQAHGFRIDTPEASLVDLGTSFGVNFGDQKNAEFVVFDGRVRIENKKQKALLTNGHCLRVDPDQQLQEAPFHGSPYKQTWLLAEGIISTTGAVVPVEPDTPEGIASQTDDLHVLVSPETRNVPLRRNLKVDLLKPGTFSAKEWNAKTSVALKHTHLDENLTSYLLHARVKRPLESKTDHVRYQGSVTFAEPVVAIIASQNLMKKCDDLFATGPWKNVELPINNRGLESNLEAPSDKLTLSEDRLTITIDFHTGYGIDEVRVLTSSSIFEP